MLLQATIWNKIKQMKKIIILLLLSIVNGARAQEVEINAVLDAWHKAAEEAEFETYFAFFADEARFIGTDASENWTVGEFKTYAKSSFQTAPAWKFIPLQRNVEVADTNQFAWFDEILTSEHLGVCRGSGVLVFEDETWKIKHYVLSLIIPNELAKDIAKQKKEADAKSVIKLKMN